MFLVVPVRTEIANNLLLPDLLKLPPDSYSALSLPATIVRLSLFSSFLLLVTEYDLKKLDPPVPHLRGRSL